MSVFVIVFIPVYFIAGFLASVFWALAVRGRASPEVTARQAERVFWLGPLGLAALGLAFAFRYYDQFIRHLAVTPAGREAQAKAAAAWEFAQRQAQVAKLEREAAALRASQETDLDEALGEQAAEQVRAWKGGDDSPEPSSASHGLWQPPAGTKAQAPPGHPANRYPESRVLPSGARYVPAANVTRIKLTSGGGSVHYLLPGATVTMRSGIVQPMTYLAPGLSRVYFAGGVWHHYTRGKPGPELCWTYQGVVRATAAPGSQLDPS